MFTGVFTDTFEKVMVDPVWELPFTAICALVDPYGVKVILYVAGAIPPKVTAPLEGEHVYEVAIPLELLVNVIV